MATFGRTGTGASTSTSSADANLANRSTEASSSPTLNGTLVAVHARLYIDSGTTVAQATIWDATGAPIAIGDEVTISNTSVTDLTFPFSGANAISLIAGTGYTYGVSWKDPGSVSIHWYRQNASSTSFKNNVAYVVGSPQNPIGSATVSGPVDIYVEYTPVTNQQGILLML